MSDSGLTLTNELHERRLALNFPDLPAGADGLKLCWLSDLHVKRAGGIYDRLVAWLSANAFDLGCFGGDLQYGESPETAAAVEVMREIRGAAAPRLGWFYVRGNHDRAALVRRVDALGYRHLRNANVGLLDGALTLAGVDDPHRGRHDVDQALAGISAGAFVVLLAHSADVIHEAEARGIQLVLSGHTHGGQIRLPFAGPLWTQLRVGNQFAYGLSRKRGTTVYTTSGIGYARVPIRVNCPPEVVLITLRRASGPHVDSGPVLI